MNQFEKLFMELTRQHDHTVVFNDFLAYTVDQFRVDNNQPHFNHDKYDKEEYSLFYDLFQHLIQKTNQVLNGPDTVGWFDMLGVFYEDVIQSKWKAGNRGQFFTPVNVCEIMAELTLSGQVESMDKSKVLSCYDSACGSSRTLLAYHVRRPYDVCVGGDLDRTSCLMSVVNFILHGVKGVVLNMDSLSGEFYGGWKTNEFVDEGFPFTVEYVTSYDSCIGMLEHDDDGKIVVENDMSLMKSSKSVQTTLI